MASSGVRQKSEYRSDAVPAPVTRPVPSLDQEPSPHRESRGSFRPFSTKRLVGAIVASILTLAAAFGLLLAPTVALVVAIWASISALTNLWRLYTLAKAGQALVSPQIPALLHTLDIAERAGFLAVGYLALIFALITLMGGLFGRGWGRLFILPGVAFTVTSVALLIIGLLFSAPLDSILSMPSTWLIPLAIYALVDAVLVSGVLVDAGLTRSPTATGGHRVIRKPLSRESGKRRAASHFSRHARPTPPTI